MRSIRNCPVAVVGGAGFLGSHLTDHLIEDRGCDVLVIDNLAAGRREFVHPRARFEHADITGPESHLLQLFRRHRARFVFNYAAWPYVPDSYARPLQVCDVNFFGAMKVINAAQEAGAEAVLQVSSAEVYGGEHYGSPFNDGFEGKIDEDFPVTPHSSYGASKAAIDAWVQVRWREAQTPCVALRQFNVCGERESHAYIVPEVISQLSHYITSARGGAGYDCAKTWEHYSPGKVPVVKLGNNSARDFLYAGDAVRMAVELLEKGQFGEVYNSGSQESIQIYDLAKLIGRVMGFADVCVECDESRCRPWEIWHLQSDNSKLYSAIDYRPRVSLEEALRRTVAYFEAGGRRWCWEGGRAALRTA